MQGKGSDKIAYIHHDVDDAIRGHIIKEEEIPKEFTDILGHSSRERLNTIIHDIVSNSEDNNDITMSPDIEHAMLEMRKYMFRSVYTNPVAKGEEGKAEGMLEYLFGYYEKHPHLLPEEYLHMIENKGETVTRVVCDYIAGMTDRYAVAKFKEIYIPRAWSIY
ncbi:MAG: deoxyguanosinetriphosphate triphosphohydrolase [Anaerocolumna sp.]|nr:deoxyguanosinetriphosphate triphosphohydrolase [Anaerocolumna sp.]